MKNKIEKLKYKDLKIGMLLYSIDQDRYKVLNIIKDYEAFIVERDEGYIGAIHFVRADEFERSPEWECYKSKKESIQAGIVKHKKYLKNYQKRLKDYEERYEK